MIVSPLNPFKAGKTISPDLIRYRMMKAALEGSDSLFASDFEFGMESPSYTVNTLAALRANYPKHRFSLIMGSDNLAGFQDWKDPEHIISQHNILVYPRPGVESHLADSDYGDHEKVKLVEAPMIDVSATAIREAVSNGSSVRFLTPDPVIEIIEAESLYKS